MESARPIRRDIFIPFIFIALCLDGYLKPLSSRWNSGRESPPSAQKKYDAVPEGGRGIGCFESHARRRLNASCKSTTRQGISPCLFRRVLLRLAGLADVNR